MAKLCDGAADYIYVYELGPNQTNAVDEADSADIDRTIKQFTDCFKEHRAKLKENRDHILKETLISYHSDKRPSFGVEADLAKQLKTLNDGLNNPKLGVTVKRGPSKGEVKTLSISEFLLDPITFPHPDDWATNKDHLVDVERFLNKVEVIADILNKRRTDRAGAIRDMRGLVPELDKLYRSLKRFYDKKYYSGYKRGLEPNGHNVRMRQQLNRYIGDTLTAALRDVQKLEVMLKKSEPTGRLDNLVEEAGKLLDGLRNLVTDKFSE